MPFALLKEITLVPTSSLAYLINIIICLEKRIRTSYCYQLKVVQGIELVTQIHIGEPCTF